MDTLTETLSPTIANGHMTAAVLYGSENLKIESVDIPRLASRIPQRAQRPRDLGKGEVGEMPCFERGHPARKRAIVEKPGWLPMSRAHGETIVYGISW